MVQWKSSTVLRCNLHLRWYFVSLILYFLWKRKLEMVFFAPLWKSESMAVWWRGQTARGEDWWRSVKQQWTPRPSHPPLPTVWGKRTNEKANRQTVWKRKSIWSNSSDIIYAYFYSSDFRLPPSLHVFNVLYYMTEASLSLSKKCTKPKKELNSSK